MICTQCGMTIPDNSHMCPYCHDKIYHGWIDSISVIIAIPVCLVFAVIGYLIGDSFEELGFFRHFVAGGGAGIGLFVGAIVSGLIGGIYGEKKFTAKARRQSESSIINNVQQSSSTESKVEDDIRKEPPVPMKNSNTETKSVIVIAKEDPIAINLQRLEDLKKKGLLTDEEFQEKRKSLIEQL